MTSSFFRGVGLLVSGLVLSSAAPLAAQDALHLVGGAAVCMPVPSCAGDADICLPFPGTTCEDIQIAGRVQTGCIAADRVRYCCDMDDDCPLVDGVAGSCGRPTDASLTRGVCRYIGIPDMCLLLIAGSSNAEVLKNCLTRPGVELGPRPYGTVPFGLGDCDDDGTANADDVCVCDPSNICSGVDGGLVVGVDANVPPGTGLDFRGAGGCACEVGGVRANGTSGFAALLLTLSGLFAVRTRRRRNARIHAKADLRD